MIYYPGGAFPFGPNKTPVNLGPFYIDETEVSNADFAEFCRATGCAAPTGAPDLPVVRVTIAQARSYAQWKGRRLPTAQEWERAARGVDAMRYPWGNEDDPKRANLLDNPTLVNHALMPVRSFAKLPEYQMAGNAWEIIDTPVTPSDAAVAMFATLLTPAPTREERWNPDSRRILQHAAAGGGHVRIQPHPRTLFGTGHWLPLRQDFSMRRQGVVKSQSPNLIPANLSRRVAASYCFARADSRRQFFKTL